jgi:hypothetical protein
MNLERTDVKNVPEVHRYAGRYCIYVYRECKTLKVDDFGFDEYEACIYRETMT